MLAPEYGGDGKKSVEGKYTDPVAAFPAHLGPNDLLFYNGKMFPEKYRNGAFIVFHGQSPELKKGYLVAFVPFKNGKPSGDWEIFADNFAGFDLAKPNGAALRYRPAVRTAIQLQESRVIRVRIFQVDRTSPGRGLADRRSFGHRRREGLRHSRDRDYGVQQYFRVERARQGTRVVYHVAAIGCVGSA